MELVLALQEETLVRVSCDDGVSHTFDLRPLLSPNDEQEAQILFADPVAYGRKIYAALFPADSVARQTLAEMPERVLLVVTEPLLDAIAWEYVYGLYGADDAEENFLVLECPFVRGLPAAQRIAPPQGEQSLHLVAVPSNPFSDALEPLAIEEEWLRLKEAVEQVPYAMTLERTTPPTLERVRHLLANRKGRVVHFMGHGGQDEQRGAVLCFEQENGALQLVTAKEFVQRVRGTIFLVTLNACVSATPGPTPFSNLAAALVRQKTPYALGMRASILDEDARTFSRVFYNELARGIPVEEALFQTRLTLAQRSPRSWVVGVPVLYTALAAPAPGFVCEDGTPTIADARSPIDLAALPPVEGTFQGRVKDLAELGTRLTGDQRPRIVTILGSGGQGKTALALKAAERFSVAWPGGVWATTLENLPARSTFAIALAQFFGIQAQETLDSEQVERLVLARLHERRTLLVLDNAETLVEAVEVQNTDALHLVEFLKKLPGPTVSLLVTSRVPLGWDDEDTHELGGLSPEEGAALFRQGAPQRRNEIDRELAASLSRALEGHPLGLRLLAGAFNDSGKPLAMFLQGAEERLREAENKYVGLEHRHRKLYACIETSVHVLDPPLRSLLSGLWIFHAPFLAESVVAIFDPDTQETEHATSPVRDQLHQLWRRSLLMRKTVTTRDGTVQFYVLLPTTRPYIEHHMEQIHARELLRNRLVTVYARIAELLYDELNRSTAVVALAQQAHEDLDRVCEAFEQEEYAVTDRSRYLLYWGTVVYRLGNSRRGLHLLEQALEAAQGTDSRLTLEISNNIALAYSGTGRRQEALRLYEEALPLIREVGDRAGEATTLNNMAVVYFATGQPQKALKLYEEALLLKINVGDRAGKATVLSNMADVYRATGYPQEALKLYEEALPLIREAGDRAGEATTLNNMAVVYSEIGRVQKALKLYEEALSLTREAGDRAGEAVTLNNIALIYNTTARVQDALKLHEEALSLAREVGDRAGEVATLNNIALVYCGTGRVPEALKLYEEALSLTREIGDRAGETTTFGNIAAVYQHMGRLQEALKLYEEALSIARAVGNRVGEAAALNNIATVYQRMGRLQEAFELYKEALSIAQAIGNRVREAVTLNNMAGVYHDTGRVQEALHLYKEALLLRREVGDLAGEANTLNNMAEVYRTTGWTQEALKLYKEALPFMRKVEDRVGEANVLNNIALVYNSTGLLQEAFELYKEALFLRREVGDRAGEAVSLNNLAGVYCNIGRVQEALILCEQALSLMREVGDRAGEALALNNMAGMYRSAGHLPEALQLYEKALSLRREVGDRAGEATTLNNIALVDSATGRPQEALTLYEEALPLMREIGDRAGEAATLNGLAYLYQSLQKYLEALKAFEQSIVLAQQITSPAAEIAGLIGLAGLLYSDLNRPIDAIAALEHALQIFEETGLPQDGAGQTAEQVQQLLTVMRNGIGADAPSMLPTQTIQQIVSNTIAVMTVAQEHHTEWHQQITTALQNAQQQEGVDWQYMRDFFAAVLAFLDGESPTLLLDHPYGQAVEAIRQGINTTGGETA